MIPSRVRKRMRHVLGGPARTDLITYIYLGVWQMASGRFLSASIAEDDRDV